MVHLTSVHDPFHARVIAARLGSDGIFAELRGAFDSPYPVPGEVGVFVGADDLPTARELLLADQVESCFDDTADTADTADIDDRPTAAGRPISAVRWLAAIAVVAVLTAVLAVWLGRGL